MNIPLNQSSGLLPPETPAEADDLSEFQFYLVRKNMADNTIRVYLYAIRQFFCLFLFSLPPIFSYISCIYWNITEPRPSISGFGL